MQVLDSSAQATVTHDAPPVLRDNAPPKRLEQLMREACAVRHYSRRTFQAYWHWAKRFILWSGKRHPSEMGQAEAAAFLSWLATTGHVSASTQRQALHGILFLYQKTLGIEVGWVDDIVLHTRHHRPQSLHTSRPAPRCKRATRQPIRMQRRRRRRASMRHSAGPGGWPLIFCSVLPVM